MAHAAPAVPAQGHHPGPATAYFATAVYIGYFGAAGGILAIVVLASIIDLPLTHVNAAKVVLSGIANGTAAIGFALFGPSSGPSWCPWRWGCSSAG